MQIGTYNVLKPGPATRHNPAWETRKHDVVKNIAAANLDVVCIQELAVSEAPWLKEKAQSLGYSFHYEENPNEGKTQNLAVGILYKAAKYDLVGKDKHLYERRCTLQLDLKDKVSQLVSRVASVHIYGGASHGNTLGTKQIESFRPQIESGDGTVHRIIIAGDFNSDMDEEALPGRDEGTKVCSKLLTKQVSSAYQYATALRDSEGRKIPTTTKPSGRHLDWVFVGTKDPEAFIRNHNIQVAPVGNQVLSASDHKLHAIVIKDGSSQNNPFEMTQTKGSVAMPEELQRLLSHSDRFTRNDVSRDKNAAMQKIDQWLRDGLIKKEGHGRDTTYVSTLPHPIEKSLEKAPKKSNWKAISIIASVFSTILKIIGAVCILMAGGRVHHHPQARVRF